MNIIEEHRTPDGLYRFVVGRTEDGDLSLGFEGFPSHTHGDILAGLSGLPMDEAVRAYLDDLLQGRSFIAIARVGDTIRDVWVAEDAVPDRYKPEDEMIAFRYWDGRSAF